MTLTLSIDTTCTFFELAEGNKLIDVPLFEVCIDRIVLMFPSYKTRQTKKYFTYYQSQR